MPRKGHSISEITIHPPQTKELVAVLAVGCFAAYMLSGHSVNDWPFEDSANYFSVARSILNGDGLQTDLVYYSEQASFGTIPAPQTVFPPGYSAVLACMSWLWGQTVESAAQNVCLFSFAFSAPLLFCLSVFAGLTRKSAWLVTIVWLSTSSAWVYTLSAASESLFIVFTMSSVLCCTASKDRRWLWVCAGIAAALAFSLRYVGVFLLLTFGVAAAREYFGQFRRFTLWSMAVLGPGIFLMAILFARNHLLTGNWRGGNQCKPPPFGEVLLVFYYSVTRIIGFSKGALLRGEFVSVAWLTGIFTLLFTSLSCASPKRILTWWRQLDLRQTTILMYAPISVVLLFYLDLTSNSGMTTRLLLPTMPFCLITLALVVEAIMRYLGWRQRLTGFAVGLTITAMMLGQPIAMSEFHDDVRPGRRIRAILQQPVRNGKTLLANLQERVTKRAPLLCTLPQLTHFYVQRPLLGLPTQYFDAAQQEWTGDRTREYVTKFGVKYVLVMTGSEINNDAKLFREIANGEIPNWLQQVETGPGFQLFELNSHPTE